MDKVIEILTEHRKDIVIEEKGYQDGLYGFTYIDPNWAKEELETWGRGYKRGLQEREKVCGL